MAKVVRTAGQGENMEDKDHGDKQDQLDEHSLPGTNQAGKGPGSSEKKDQENGQENDPENDDEHSLPGTNQAGKGPGSS